MTSKTQTVTFVRPRTGKTYQRINGVWHLNGKPIPESGKGSRAVQWQIEGEYQAIMKERELDEANEFWKAALAHSPRIN